MANTLDLFFLKCGHAKLTSRIIHFGWNAEPFNLLNSGPGDGLYFAVRSLLVDVMEYFCLGITDVSLSKIWRIESSCQIFRRSKYDFAYLNI